MGVFGGNLFLTYFYSNRSMVHKSYITGAPRMASFTFQLQYSNNLVKSPMFSDIIKNYLRTIFQDIVIHGEQSDYARLIRYTFLVTNI